MKQEDATQNFRQVKQTYDELQINKTNFVNELKILTDAKLQAERIIAELTSRRDKNPHSVVIKSNFFKGEKANETDLLWKDVSQQIANIKLIFDDRLDDINRAIRKQKRALKLLELDCRQAKESLGEAARQSLRLAKD